MFIEEATTCISAGIFPQVVVCILLGYLLNVPKYVWQRSPEFTMEKIWKKICTFLVETEKNVIILYKKN